MDAQKLKINRNYGYDILINNFEPALRDFSIEVLLNTYAENWKDFIPQGVFKDLSEIKDYQVTGDCLIEDFFEELSFKNLKDILVYSNNFKLAKPFFSELNKQKFNEIMDELNIIRRKIAHGKSKFSELDLLLLKENVRLLCQGEKGKDLRLYLEMEGYKNAKDIPSDFFVEYDIQNNLPAENYDLDGGFVGRTKEIRAIMKYIRSAEDRVITITGAGGVGKTAIALKIAYHFLAESPSQFDAIIWFSAKTNKLTEEGIIPITPEITSHEKLVHDILITLDPDTHEKFVRAKVNLDSYINHIYNLFSSNKCLFIVDNLETIIQNNTLIKFITNIPRPSQLLITSRKGLGEFERRYPLTDMPVDDAILLFRIIAKERNRTDLLKLSTESIQSLVTRVKCYPLLIKWSIGQVCLGKELDDAFSQIFAGDSAIAEFSFNDVFDLLSETSKIIIYSMVIYGNKAVSATVLKHLGNLTEDQFEDAIKELIRASFVFPESKETPEGTITVFCMLELTRGFIEAKLDNEQSIREMLQTRHYHLSKEIEDFERSKTSYYQSEITLGIKSPEERVAYYHVKAAKNFFFQDNEPEAENNFQLALKAAPNFSYVLTEYSKYQFKQNHKIEALKYAKKAVVKNQDSFHAWFNYGIMLKKMRKIKPAIDCFKKAKKLNPSHLPIFTELGRSYTLDGKNDLAEIEFKEALREEKYPNYRHKVITLAYHADNYRRWSQSFVARRDTEGAIKKLDEGKNAILEAIEISPRDGRSYHRLFQIYIDLALLLHPIHGYEASRAYLEKCIKPVYYGNYRVRVYKDTIAKAHFYLAAFSINDNVQNFNVIKDLIERGTALTKDSGLIAKFEDLSEQIKCLQQERKNGIIRNFNVSRRFGIIESESETYLFLLVGFRKKVDSIKLYQLAGKEVSFILRKNPRKTSELIADDIVFE